MTSIEAQLNVKPLAEAVALSADLWTCRANGFCVTGLNFV